MNCKILLHSLFIFSIFFAACSTGEKEPDCKYGSPVAMFSDSIPGVVQHTFSVDGQDGTESVQLERGLKIEVLQSGCDKIRQEFRFNIQESLPDTTNWIETSGNLFISISGLDPNLAPLANWGTAIQQFASELKLGESKQVGEGFYIKIDRIKQGQNNLLIAVLSETDD
ncbi:MAG: hypothetical protein R2769_13625 [Saprospiraceae bacterium]